MLGIILGSYRIGPSCGGLDISKLDGQQVVFVQGDEANSLIDELIAAPTNEAASIIIEAYVTT